MPDLLADAEECIARCRALAQHTEEPGFTTRTFLSGPMRAVHADLRRWMEGAGLSVTVDAAGNLRGASAVDAPTLYIGSHLDTVPQAGAFDGILGVVIGVKLAELFQPRRFRLEVIGFSEEEGVRFGFPFIGSLAFIGECEPVLTPSIDSAICAFGLDPAALPFAIAQPASLGYLEFHIEQGPVLESLDLSIGVVDAIAGQTRLDVGFQGRAGHAGTTPMGMREDALAGAAEWIGAVETKATAVPDLLATVGRIEAHPGAPNVIAGSVKLSLDVRHTRDTVRRECAEDLLSAAHEIARRRKLQVTSAMRLDQPAVAMDSVLSAMVARAMERSGHPAYQISSGAGHDAMIVARRMPTAMLFLRSPGGLSHHPQESVRTEDVAAALSVGMEFLADLEGCV